MATMPDKKRRERKKRKLQEIAELGESAPGFSAEAGVQHVLQSRSARYARRHWNTEGPRLANEVFSVDIGSDGTAVIVVIVVVAVAIGVSYCENS